MIKVTEKNERAKSEITYPCLGTYPGVQSIILFTEEKSGTAITAYMQYNIGYHSNNWNPAWELYTGEITLSNEEA